MWKFRVLCGISKRGGKVRCLDFSTGRRFGEKPAKLQQKLCKSRHEYRGSVFLKLLITLVWRRSWQDLVNFVRRFATAESGVRSSPGPPIIIRECAYWTIGTWCRLNGERECGKISTLFNRILGWPLYLYLPREPANLYQRSSPHRIAPMAPGL